jgi:hypothetical protein
MKYEILDQSGNVVNRIISGESFVEQHYPGQYRLIDDSAEQDAEAASGVRQVRDRFLSECDWVVIMHTEKGTNIPAQWELYRQSLRDITAQAGFPHSITWPTKPE